MKVHTTSGAVYEIEEVEPGDVRVRRVNDGHVKRGDGEWQRLVGLPVVIEDGEPMVLVMESLARYGTDDLSPRFSRVGPVTTRVTTPVTSVTGRLTDHA